MPFSVSIMDQPPSNLAKDLGILIGLYGYQDVHIMLSKYMNEDYEYLKTVYEGVTLVKTNAKPQEITPTSQVQSQTQVKTDPPQKRKYNKKSDKIIEAVINPSPPPITEEAEIKDVLVTSPLTDRQYRDPKEIKAFQKAAEESKNNENQAAGFQVTDILTKENLEKWIEQECRTYAWVAREKAGCPETQVAATAQMMGIKSKISKKRGIIMGGK
jgi:hypothetical protein